MTVNYTRFWNSKKDYKWSFKKILILVLVFFSIVLYFRNRNISMDQNVYFRKWDWVERFFTNIWSIDKFFLKLYIKRNDVVLNDIKTWVYMFSWSYSKKDFIETLKKWPSQKYVVVTLLEWWSKYDTDQWLYRKTYISKNDYISFVEDKKIISKYITRYEFLSLAEKWTKNWLESLEWFLYPDTYYLEPSGNIIDQLVYLQLENFNKKVWIPYKAIFNSLNSKLSRDWYNLNISLYDIVKLSSIIEKEEKNDKNKPTLAWIFFNRLKSNMRIDADISLCYWLKIPYSDCSVKIISKNIKDSGNLYNTRAVSWLTPTPIGSPSLDTISSVLEYEKTSNYFYLHDKNGKLYPAKSIEEHNLNKSKHLN